MRKEAKGPDSKPDVLEAALERLEAARSLNTQRIESAIGLLDGLATILWNLSDAEMSADDWKSLAANLAPPIQTAVKSSSDQLEAVKKGIRKSWEAHDLLFSFRNRANSITIETAKGTQTIRNSAAA